MSSIGAGGEQSTSTLDLNPSGQFRIATLNLRRRISTSRHLDMLAGTIFSLLG
jgi:hypothetical protein